MPDMAFRLQLRPSTLDDADLVAALQAQRDPDDLSDPVLLRYWWQMANELQRVDIHPLSQDTDPDGYQQLYEMVIESEMDIPRTVPWRVLSFPEWQRFWLGNPGIREDLFWIACEGGRIVGTSVLDCPVTRGIPWTAFTGTLRSVRGRGIARALKYESMAQAIEAGYTRVRTNNDADNPPILRVNEEMGYRLVTPIVELHRSLGQ